MSVVRKPWLRARITGGLEVESPLHIGSGDTYEIERKTSQEDDVETTLVDAVCKGVDGKPCLPATTLRGALRARLVDTAMADILFGTARGETRSTGGGMGKLRCYDAVAETDVTVRRSGTALDPLLGVVGAHKLYTHEIVPRGSRFALMLEVDHVTPEELAVVLGLLESLGGEIAAGLGSGKRRDQGRLQWRWDSLDVIDAESLAAWTENGESALPWRKLPIAIQPDRSACLGPPPCAAFEIEFHTPWLVDAPERRREKTASDPHPPDLEFSRTGDGRAWLPASSLKGWIRGRARRILMTLMAGRDCTLELGQQRIDTLLEDIFGATDRAGWLIVSDAYSEQSVAAHSQQFVAINRFTGGSSDGALYNVNAASPCVVRGQLGWKSTLHGEGDWRLGLLALVARDAMEGDLVLGWGKARGFGQAFARVRPPGETTCLDWAKLVPWLKDRSKAHLCALQDKLDSLVSETGDD